MNIAGLSALSAPQVTGHPFGLPDAKRDPAPETKVQPVVGVRDAETERWSGPPARFWRTANGGPDPVTHVAPPSIVQIKISQLLDAQATAQTEDADPAGTGDPEPDTSGTATAPTGARGEDDAAEDDAPNLTKKAIAGEETPDRTAPDAGPAGLHAYDDAALLPSGSGFATRA